MENPRKTCAVCNMMGVVPDEQSIPYLCLCLSGEDLAAPHSVCGDHNDEDCSHAPETFGQRRTPVEAMPPPPFS